MYLDKCRLCLTSSDDYLDIFSNDGLERNLLDILKLHFNFAITEINNNDLYPKKLCRTCWIKIDNFHNFYLKVLTIQDEFFLEQKVPLCIQDDHNPENHNSTYVSKIKTNLELDSDDEIPLIKVIENEKKKKKCVAENRNNDDETKQENEQIQQFFTMECDLCASGKFASFGEVKSHYLIQHEITKGYVICCKRKFKSLPTIREHILWHTNPEVFTCKLCNKLYVNKSGLDNHKLSHVPAENCPHKCEICEKSFYKYKQLKRHNLNHTLSAMDRKFKCEICDNGFPQELLLRNHKRVVHEGVYSQTFICDICAKVFKNKIMFNRHRNEDHLGLTPPKIQCQLCGAWIKSERYLRRHMIRHEDESKEFICKYCGKKSPNREALRKHERYVHILEPKFKCTYCNKVFKRSVWLKEHLTTHTGEILYTCMFCTKTSNSNANMNSHKLKVHKDEWEKYKIENKL